MLPSERAFEDAQPSPVRKSKIGTFRVSTVDDFSSSTRNERIRRRSGLPSTACQTCRSRKVKCRVSVIEEGFSTLGEPSQPPRCQACQQADIDCRWDTVDKRKRRKVQSTNDASEDAETLPMESIRVIGDGQQPASEESHLHNTAASQPSGGEDLSGHPGERSAQMPEDLNSILVGVPELGSRAHREPSEVHSEMQPPSRELFSFDNKDMSYDWSEIQDLVVDFDGMENVSNINWDSILADRQSDDPAATPRPPAKAMRLRLYRRFGPTAVLPGLRKLSIAVNTRSPDGSGESDASSHPGTSMTLYSRRVKATHPSPGTPMSDDSPYDLPLEGIRQIAEVFFNRLACYFPFVEPKILDGHVRSGQASSLLMNAIAALTMRFCPVELSPGTVEAGSDSPWRNGTYFLKRAKEQLVTLLAIPTTDIVSGILVLAWAEFGDNNEAGLWMLSGMAIRMAQDMGLHRCPEKEANPSSVAFWDRSPLSPDGKGLLSDEMSKLHQAKSKLILFWTVFFLDVFVSLLTGRPPTLKRLEVEVPIPTTDDMKAAQLDFQEQVSMKNKIFPEIARFMLLYSEAVELLNQTRSEENTEAFTSSNESSQRSKLEKVRDQIMNLYQSLPPDLAFTIDNYKAASVCKQAGQFLMLHVYFYTFTILLSRKHSSAEESSNSPQPQAVLVACQKIVQMLNTAELIDKTGYLSVPFINQGLFVAASTILEEQQSNQNRPQDLFSLVSGTDVEYLCKKLQEMSHYFRGTGVTLAALERRRREVAAKTTRGNNSSEDEESDEEKNEVVQLSDGGIVNRYSIPEEGS
ncbi:C6 transcription factor [Colletotrichum kahawae]|uniref:C6 transcription factor n=1 Tax=Colletotrichum kahawae TaxID=34407 RepID=A0AAE0D7H9_COLKA|nr:C6 transcription factor [Colletotrichum kahawae]